MSNKETLQSYNTKLTENNISLDSILETINKLPEYKEETSTKITNLTELDNAIISCVDNLLEYHTDCINQYECDSDEPITLYTPKEGFNYYFTRYRNGGYQVLWFADRMIKERNPDYVTELNTRKISVSSFEIDSNDMVGVSNQFETTYVDDISTAYLSPMYSTLQELFNAMQDSTTAYTNTESSIWGVDNQSSILAPYTNMVYFDYLDNMVMRKRISSNEKIEVQ